MEINSLRTPFTTGNVLAGAPTSEPDTGTDSVSLSGHSASPAVGRIDPSMIKSVFEHSRLTPLWEIEIPKSHTDTCALHPMENGRICVGSYNTLLCLDGESGKTLWQKKIDNYFGSSFDSQYTDGRQCLKTSDVNRYDDDSCQAVVLDARDGSEMWRHRIDKFDMFQINDSHDLFMKQPGGYLVLDGKDGSVKKNTALPGEKYIQAGAVRGDGAVYASSPDKTYMISSDGSVMWQEGGSSHDPAFFRGDRIVASRPTGELAVRDTATGNIIWSGARIRASHVSDTSIFGSNIYDLHCLDLSDGHEKWSIKGEQDRYSVIKAFDSDGIPYVARENRIEALDPDTGKPRWSLALPSDQLERRSSALLDGKRLLLNDGGRIHVIDTTNGLKTKEFCAPEGSCISNFVVTPEGTLLVQVKEDKNSSWGPSRLCCVDLKGDKDEKGSESRQGTVEEEDNWVEIDGIRLYKNR